ncbi:MAG: EamA family transporter [Spirochaetales bacterium]|nr:EamA family transporter [Spirochaetales bacterium]
MKSENRSIKTVLLALLACFLWSTAFTFIKIGLKYSQPFSFAAFRFMLAGILLVPFYGKYRILPAFIKRHGKTILLLGIFQTFILYAFFYFGMTLVSGATGAITTGISPVMAGITAHFLLKNDKLTFPKIISLFFGVAGVVLLSLGTEPFSSRGWGELPGILILLISCLSSAIGNIMVARSDKTANPVILNSLQIFTGGFFLLILSLFVEGIPVVITEPEFYMAFIYLSFVSAAAFSIWFHLLKKPGVTVSYLNIWKFIMPVSGAILSWLILPGEKPSLYPVIGMGLIAISVIAVNVTNLKRPKP